LSRRQTSRATELGIFEQGCLGSRLCENGLRAELLSFPAGKHDDQVDALGLVGQLLDRISVGQKPKLPEVAHQDDYRSASDEMHDVSSSVKLL
jgi:hypothetical protein